MVGWFWLCLRCVFACAPSGVLALFHEVPECLFFSALVVVVLLVGWFLLVCVVGGACPCVCRAGFHLCSLPSPLLSFISHLLAIAIFASICCC